MASVNEAIQRAYNELGERRFAGICGAHFKGDAWFEEHVPACSRQEEVRLRNVCPIYTCARQRGVEHCGVCDEFPCQLLLLFAAHDARPGERVVSAAMRAALGEDGWTHWVRERSFVGILCPLQPRARSQAGRRRAGVGAPPDGRRPLRVRPSYGPGLSAPTTAAVGHSRRGDGAASASVVSDGG